MKFHTHFFQAVVIGCFNFSGVSKTPGYREFYKSATSSLEKYPNREVIFAALISPSDAESRYSVYQYPSATLLMWNESLVCNNLILCYYNTLLSFKYVSFQCPIHLIRLIKKMCTRMHELSGIQSHNWVLKVQRYPENNLWNSESIVNWVSNSVHQPSVWLQPGNRASTLAPYVLNQPALVMFTPRNPYQNENHNYNLVCVI